MGQTLLGFFNVFIFIPIIYIPLLPINDTNTFTFEKYLVLSLFIQVITRSFKLKISASPICNLPLVKKIFLVLFVFCVWRVTEN